MNIFHTIDALQETYLDFLCKICSFEARAYDKSTLDAMSDYITDFVAEQGMRVSRTPMEKCGDFLTVEINPGGEKGCMFQAHMDTVHDKGTFGQPPVRVEGDRIIGPGVIDCKGGIAVAMLAMKALFNELLSACQKHGLGSLTPLESGGGSDSCYTQAAGIPSICGLGASGRYQHTSREYVNKDTVALRSKILCAFLPERK